MKLRHAPQLGIQDPAASRSAEVDASVTTRHTFAQQALALFRDGRGCRRERDAAIGAAVRAARAISAPDRDSPSTRPTRRARRGRPGARGDLAIAGPRPRGIAAIVATIAACSAAIREARTIMVDPITLLLD